MLQVGLGFRHLRRIAAFEELARLVADLVKRKAKDGLLSCSRSAAGIASSEGYVR